MNGLANVQNNNGYRPTYQVSFNGLNHTKSAKDGEIYWMENMSSDDFPILSQRQRRCERGLNAEYGFMCVDNHIARVYDRVEAGEHYDTFDYRGYHFDLEPTHKQRRMAMVNTQIMIIPDNKVFNTRTGIMKSIDKSFEGEVTLKRYSSYGGVDYNCATIYADVKWDEYFSVGDAIHITGMSVNSNNGSHIIRNIDGNNLNFDDNSFVLTTDKYTYEVRMGYPAGDYCISLKSRYLNFTLKERLTAGDTIEYSNGELKVKGVNHPSYISTTAVGDKIPVTESYSDTVQNVTISRNSVELDYIFSSNNRIWGCKDDTIYSSKLGDPLNWNVFDGISTDSYALETGTAGKFTGAIDYLGYPMFFKDNRIFKVYGNYPQQYEVVNSMKIGVTEGCSDSLAIAGETLFYLSRQGIMAYTGGVPQLISQNIGMKLTDAVGGSDGRKYYISCIGEYCRHLFVYDTYYRTWHREDTFFTKHMDFGDKLYATDKTGKLWEMTDGIGQYEDDFMWSIETADTELSTFNHKGLSQIRIQADTSRLHSTQFAKVYTKVDNGGWECIGDMTKGPKHIDTFPAIPKTGQRIKIKIQGIGKVDIYGISINYYIGSDVVI